MMRTLHLHSHRSSIIFLFLLAVLLLFTSGCGVSSIYQDVNPLSNGDTKKDTKNDLTDEGTHDAKNDTGTETSQLANEGHEKTRDWKAPSDNKSARQSTEADQVRETSDAGEPDPGAHQDAHLSGIKVHSLGDSSQNNNQFGENKERTQNNSSSVEGSEHESESRELSSLVDKSQQLKAKLPGPDRVNQMSFDEIKRTTGKAIEASKTVLQAIRLARMLENEKRLKQLRAIRKQIETIKLLLQERLFQEFNQETSSSS